MTDPASPDPAVRDAAFALARPPGGGPGPLFQLTEDAAVARLAETGASREARRAAVKAVRALCDAAIELADQERDGGVSGDAARAELERRVPGFTAGQYDAALALGLWFTR